MALSARSVLSVVSVSLAALLNAGITFGQVAQAALRGVFTDESGAVLPGVTITATQSETGATRTTVTTATGAYLMPALGIGSYVVKAELSGFSTVLHEGLKLGVGESVVVNFSMK